MTVTVKAIPARVIVAAIWRAYDDPSWAFDPEHQRKAEEAAVATASEMLDGLSREQVLAIATGAATLRGDTVAGVVYAERAPS